MGGSHIYSSCPENEQFFQNPRIWRVIMKRKQIFVVFFFSLQDILHRFVSWLHVLWGAQQEQQRSYSWLAVSLQFASGCPNRMQAGLQSWEVFGVPVPYLTPTRGPPSTCGVKLSPHLHVPPKFSHTWESSTGGTWGLSGWQGLGINNITPAEWM